MIASVFWQVSVVVAAAADVVHKSTTNQKKSGDLEA